MPLKFAALSLSVCAFALIMATAASAEDDPITCGRYARQVASATTAAQATALVNNPVSAECPEAAAEARRKAARLTSPPPPPPPPVVASPPPSPPAVARQSPPPPPAPAADEVAWRNAQRTNSCEGYRGFLSLFAESRFAAQARSARDRRCAPPPPQPAAAEPQRWVNAKTAPSSVRAPLVSNPASLPDFALFRECEGCPEMVVIPGGSFLMGSPAGEAGREEDEDSVAGAGGGQIRVSIPRFAIARFETTWEEWEACVAAGVCQQDQVDSAGGDHGWGRGRRPVIAVDWNDAGVFARWVNGRASVSAYRRPTEAEWEYAVRAGTTSAYFWGTDANAGCTFMNGADATAKRSNPGWTTVTCDDGALNTSSVGSYRPNPFGLFDMTGNVWEWVEDCYRDNLSGQTAAANTTGDCSLRVLRGGSWLYIPQYLRSAYRNWGLPTFRVNNRGFRLARTL